MSYPGSWVYLVLGLVLVLVGTKAKATNENWSQLVEAERRFRSKRMVDAWLYCVIAQMMDSFQKIIIIIIIKKIGKIKPPREREKKTPQVPLLSLCCG